MAASYLVINLPERLALGSCLDLSTSLNKAFNIFGDRTVISAGRTAAHLFRYRLEEAAVTQGVRIIVPGLTPQHSFEEIRNMLGAPGIHSLGIPFADNHLTSASSYQQLNKMTPPTSIRIGLANVRSAVETAFKRYDDEGNVDYSFDPVLGPRRSYFDYEVDQRFAEPPFFLNANFEAVILAVQLGGREDLIQEAGSERRPMIWTSPKEVEGAANFFDQHSLAPENTIGLHLTASSGGSYEDMLSQNDFFAASRHFIEKGYTVLLVAGNIFGNPPQFGR